MRILGLLGGVASGKSAVAELFRGLGAEVLDADRVGHEVLRLPEVREAVRAHFGPQVIDKDGQVDRRLLGRVVFGPPPDGARELAVLEGITHPQIRRRLRDEVDRMAADGAKLAVLDAPVLLKAGWDAVCDGLALVDCPENLRLQRAMARGWTAAEFAAREAAQEPIEEKRRRADFVVDNSAAMEYTQAQVERIWGELVG